MKLKKHNTPSAASAIQNLLCEIRQSEYELLMALPLSVRALRTAGG
jgi:hypothetical protein